MAQPVFGEPRAIMRRRIVVADSGIPGCLQAGGGGLFGHHGAEIAQWRRTGAKRAVRAEAGHALAPDDALGEQDIAIAAALAGLHDGLGGLGRGIERMALDGHGRSGAVLDQ